MPDTDADEPFPDLLRDQIRRGFTASQQYLAAAVYFDSNRLPQLAGHSYGKSAEHRSHALRMVQYLLDRNLQVQVGGLDDVRSTFESPRGAVVFLLESERARNAQITELARTARTSGDYLGEQFIQWFLKEQVEDVAGMTTLLTVIDRAAGDLFDVEDFIARELRTTARVDISAPRMAGAAKN
ncbi:ferritin [Nocardia pseudovaccinii]|uniref:ferritin n=1 Tax=Nocardia pseudovaccinii TaxID=189540 RepID=UPI0007A51E81|nr:ferritin [Nocardia pseudovaccinii]